MKTEIDINTAKEELAKINQLLQESHLLIGGLAVQQYYVTRETCDIDLVCDSSIAKRLVHKLYPSRDYTVHEANDDEYRPSYIITHKINKNRIVFFGPKIMERESYKAVNWSSLMEASAPFHYKRQILEKIRVPSIESLAFIKLLSFIDRIKRNPDKGHADLIDFIELCNNENFKINQFIGQIRQSKTERHIRDGLIAAKRDYDESLWDQCLLMDLFSILAGFSTGGNFNGLPFDDNFDKIYKTSESIDFYNRIAEKYDARNTNVVLNTHRRVIAAIKNKRRDLGSDPVRVLDIGAGTGRLIAHQYYASEKIVWHCVEPSKNMAKVFKETMQGSKVDLSVKAGSIFDLENILSNEDPYDVVILSLVLSSLPHNPNFDQIARKMKSDSVMIITDFYESCRFYDFTVEGEKIALYTRKIDIIDTLKSIASAKLAMTGLSTIDNPGELENTFIFEFIKI